MIVVDANVLIYAVNKSAANHQVAKGWLEGAFNSNETLGFDATVLLAFVRIVTNRRIFPNPLAAGTAVELLRDWLAQPNAVVVSTDVTHWSILGDLLDRSGAAGNLVNDAHLAALTLQHGATVASFDADFNRFDVEWMMPST